MYDNQQRSLLFRGQFRGHNRKIHSSGFTDGLQGPNPSRHDRSLKCPVIFIATDPVTFHLVKLVPRIAASERVAIISEDASQRFKPHHKHVATNDITRLILLLYNLLKSNYYFG